VVANKGVIGIVDQFLELLTARALPFHPHLCEFARDLALKTSHRNSVKVGIAMLGLCNDKTIIRELKVLGLHDEFTVFATVALINISDSLVNDLWDLARKVDGWGKIQLVDRMAKMELSAEQKDWLIRKGYQNSIMYEYLALPCAIHGELNQRLGDEEIDDELFKSSAEIIEALISGGPADDITSYIYADEVVEHFIRHAKLRSLELGAFLTFHRIKNFLIELQKDIGEQSKNGWTDNGISNYIIDVMAVLSSRNWTELALQALGSTDDATYWTGKLAADHLGIDIWDTVWSRLLLNPLNSTCWYDVTRCARTEHAEQVIEFALKSLPLAELGTGPKDSLGFGPDFIKHHALENVITFLEEYPGSGEKIILTGLNSPVTRNRNMAIRVLDKWKKENWSDAVRQQLTTLGKMEPNSQTKETIDKLIKGEELS